MLYITKNLSYRCVQRAGEQRVSLSKLVEQYQNKMIEKKHWHNSSLRNLEYKPRGLMMENNVCKTIWQKIYAFSKI